MKISLALVSAVALALGASALAGRVAAQVTNPPIMPEEAVITTSDYVEKAGQADLFEIASGELALKRSKSAAVKEFAQHMIQDHQATAAKLKATLAEAQPSLAAPSELDAAHKAKLASLEQASDGEFDRLYAEAQLSGHTDALQLHQGYADGGEVEALRTLAATTAALVTSHLAMAKELNAKHK